MDLRHVALLDLRSQIAVVTQDVPFPLQRYDSQQHCCADAPGAGAAEVEAAARHTHAHDFIMEKNGGYKRRSARKE